MQEQWNSIKYYPQYQVSSFGRVKSLGNNENRKEKILKPQQTPQGYQIVRLFNSDGYVQKSIQSLVTEAYIGTRPVFENELTDIDHIDGNRSNNHMDNLRYMTHTANVQRIDRSYQTKKVIAHTFDGNIFGVFDSMTATEEYGFDRGAVSKCCRGITKSHKDLIWTYYEKECM